MYDLFVLEVYGLLKEYRRDFSKNQSLAAAKSGTTKKNYSIFCHSPPPDRALRIAEIGVPIA